ncbi:hypothetical protein [Roseovarius sp. EL26]|uniref:hypothetical protein n=1 Tax=Roseovarius sp. EL26 TaxID=2126672 RepID=UPI000EA3A338|nr:hypothetical protein [Roseovarius sp. EL26]
MGSPAIGAYSHDVWLSNKTHKAQLYAILKALADLDPRKGAINKTFAALANQWLMEHHFTLAHRISQEIFPMTTDMHWREILVDGTVKGLSSLPDALSQSESSNQLRNSWQKEKCRCIKIGHFQALIYLGKGGSMMTITASKHSLKKNDLYESGVWAVEWIIRTLKGLWRDGVVWDPSAGNHRMVGPFYWAGAKTVITSDFTTHGIPHSCILDFLNHGMPKIDTGDFDLSTNPPNGHRNVIAQKYVGRALERCDGFVAPLLTDEFVLGSARKRMFHDNRRFRAKLALVDWTSWEENGKTGTEEHPWYIWGPRGAKPIKPDLLYQDNLSKNGVR